MVQVGILFPGQGSPLVGVGKALYDSERIVQEYFELASQCLDQNFVRLCFASSEKESSRTENAQILIYLLSSACYALFQKKLGITPVLAAGHSCGEYAALHAAGGLNFVDGLYLLNKRAHFMNQAQAASPGRMTAVLGLELPVVEQVCAQFDDKSDAVAQVANINAPTQIVISGNDAGLHPVEMELKKRGGKLIRLNVSGGFHSRLMRDAEREFAKYLVKVDIGQLQYPIVTNIGAKKINNPSEIREELKAQMSGSVRWWESMRYFYECDVIVQMGPGNTLAKILSRHWPEKKIYTLTQPVDLITLGQELGL